MAAECVFSEDVYGAWNTIIAEALMGLWITSVWSWRIKLEIPSFRSGGAKNLVQEFELYAKEFGYDPIAFATYIGWIKGVLVAGLVWAIVNPNFQLVEFCGGGMLVLMTGSIYCRNAVGDDWSKSYDAIAMWLCALCATVAPAVSLSKGCYEYSIYGVDHGTRLSIGYTVVSLVLYWNLKSLNDGDFYDWEDLLSKEEEAPEEPSCYEFFFGVSKKVEDTEAALP